MLQNRFLFDIIYIRDFYSLFMHKHFRLMNPNESDPNRRHTLFPLLMRKPRISSMIDGEMFVQIHSRNSGTVVENALRQRIPVFTEDTPVVYHSAA